MFGQEEEKIPRWVSRSTKVQKILLNSKVSYSVQFSKHIIFLSFSFFLDSLIVISQNRTMKDMQISYRLTGVVFTDQVCVKGVEL